MTERIYEFLGPPNASPSTPFLKCFYVFYYFLCKSLCDAYKDNTDVPERDFADQPFTTISASQPLPSSSSYFDIWINETSSNIFSQTSRKKLYEKALFNNWYDVFGYVTVWWTEVIKRLYSVANAIYESLKIKPVVSAEVIQYKGPVFKSAEVAEEIVESTSINYENIFHFVLLYSIIGGIILIIFLINRSRIKTKRRKKDLLTSSNIRTIETNVIEKLMTILRTTKSVDKKFKQDLETNYCKYTDAVKSLEKKQKYKIKKGEKFNHQSTITSSDTYQKNKLEKQCKVYQKQISVLQQQLQDLLKNHRTEIKNYFTENRKIKLELGKSQNWLDLSHQLHEVEANHLQKYITHLQGQYETTDSEHLAHQLKNSTSKLHVKENFYISPQNNPENTKTLKMKSSLYQRSHQEIKNHLEAVTKTWSQLDSKIAEAINKPAPGVKINPKRQGDIENVLDGIQEVDSPKCNGKEVVNKSSSTITDLQVMFENSIDPKSNLQDVENHLQRTEVVAKKRHNTTPVIEEPIQDESVSDWSITTDQDSFQDMENHFPSTKEVEIKQQNFNPILNNEPSSVKEFKNINLQKVTIQHSLGDQSDPMNVESMKIIESIFAETKKLKIEIREFTGSKTDPIYLHLKGLLIEYSIQLNNIKCERKSILWKNSKKVWRYISKCRDFLEKKVNK